MLTVNEAVADGHTPGPWEIDSQGFIYHRPDALTKYVIAEMESSIEANERLILAAPDLLAAGEEAEWFLAHYAEYIAIVPVDEIERHPYLPDLQEKLEMLRAAIAKTKVPSRA